MSGLRVISEKIGGAIDKTLCEVFERRMCTLPAGKYVSLCFDDFPQSAAKNAAPLIEDRDWRATWYVSGGFMGQTDPHYGKMFDASDLERLRLNGHDFGCHTFDHTNCRQVDDNDIALQMQRNQAFFERHNIANVRSFAFPFGATNLSAKRQMAMAGQSLRSIQAGTNRDHVDFSFLKACGLQDDKGRTARALQELQGLKERDGWLIIFTHDVRDAPSPWGVTAEEYESVLDAIAASGADVVTVGEMVDRLAVTQDVAA